MNAEHPKLTVGSLFAGIGGFDLGLEQSGMEFAWQVERDKHCNKVLAHHWPEVRRHDDVRTFTAADGYVRPDLICGGFPCQDISVAGKRAGLVGKRSGLFYEACRIISEFTPRWVLIENVPGLLSSNEGRDMGSVLGELAKLGYGTAYRVLDAQWFGVAQRRRRVFIVGCFGGEWRRAAEVLLEPESLPWHPTPIPRSRSKVATTVIKGAAIGRKSTAGPQYGEALEDGSVYTLTCTEQHAVCSGGRFRRITPTEAERLQGFPDDHTRYDADGKQITDGPRYRMLGNAVCVPVAQWIGKRILKHERCCNE